MSMTRSFEVSCDNRAGCDTPKVVAATAPLAREAAKKLGWVTRSVKGDPRDFCAAHKAREIPKGTTAACGVCHRAEVKVNADGTLRSHKPPADGIRRYMQRCNGSNQAPEATR